MADPTINRIRNHDTLGESVTVIRYRPGQEIFQMQVTLLTGKTFNFERKCSDSVSNVLTRMAANIGKKVMNFNGTVKLFTSTGSTFVDSEAEAESMEFDRILRDYVDSTSTSLQLQVGEDLYDVVFNPPEIYAVKFLGTCMPTFPLFPYKVEASENFSKEKSLYKWEFSRENPSPIISPKLRKNSKEEAEPNKNMLSTEWQECGREFIFIPEKGMEGGYLRFSCTPSNGVTLGKPFSTTLPNPIAHRPVDSFLYQERLSRLPQKLKNSLRVLSYNVLAQTYATPEWFISSPKECLDAAYRLPILNKELQLYQADVICLQEVDNKYFEGSFEPFLKAQAYRGFHTSKTGKTKEGIATFHNSAKLTLLESVECVILEHMKKLPLWEMLQSLQQRGLKKRLKERNTVFQVSVLQVNNCTKNTILLVGNVHLYFHPEADHIRLLQTITCINFLESKLASVKKTYPEQSVAIIYCGDLNCMPPFSSYRLLTTGKVDENDEDWTSHPKDKIFPGIAVNHSLKLTNSHPNHELTNITTCFEGCLDYILYQSECFKLISAYSPPSKEELAVLTKVDEVRKVSLPNMYAPSDHLPLIVDLLLKS